jgi:hypothetical protein
VILNANQLTKVGSTGILLYMLGTVRSKQGLLDEAFQYHQRALIQFRATGGDSDVDLGRACYKLTAHYLRHNSIGMARYVH